MFIDDFYSCPTPYIVAIDIAAHVLNPYFLSWKRHNQLIISALVSSMSIEILYLVVDCDISYIVFGKHLKRFLLHHHIQDLRNYMALSRTYTKKMTLSVPICKKKRSCLICWLLLANLFI